MERTITQNGALYALQHRVSNRRWNNPQIEPVSAREKIPPPRLGVNTATANKLEMEEPCFSTAK